MNDMSIESVFRLLVSDFEGYGIVEGPRKNFVEIAKQAGCEIIYYTVETEIDHLVIMYLLQEIPKTKTILFLNIPIDVNKENVSFIIETSFQYCFCTKPNEVSLYNHKKNIMKPKSYVYTFLTKS
jgi:hypothetical protein